MVLNSARVRTFRRQYCIGSFPWCMCYQHVQSFYMTMRMTEGYYVLQKALNDAGAKSRLLG